MFSELGTFWPYFISLLLSSFMPKLRCSDTRRFETWGVQMKNKLFNVFATKQITFKYIFIRLLMLIQ